MDNMVDQLLLLPPHSMKVVGLIQEHLQNLSDLSVCVQVMSEAQVKKLLIRYFKCLVPMQTSMLPLV